MNKTVPYRVGEWLPTDQAVLDTWLKTLIEEVDGVEQADGVEEVEQVDAVKVNVTLHSRPNLLPVVQELKELIENDAEINMFFHQMFSEVPKKYKTSPTGKPQVRDYHRMLRLINAILTRAPEFNETGLVGFPINAILDWSMGTTGGFAAFLNEKVNVQIKKVLNEWGVFLKSKESFYVLSKDPCTKRVAWQRCSKENAEFC